MSFLIDKAFDLVAFIDENLFLVVFIIVFLIGLKFAYRFVSSITDSPKKKAENVKSSMTKKEFTETLDFMMAHGIIDHNQYNGIFLKALPFLKD